MGSASLGGIVLDFDLRVVAIVDELQYTDDLGVFQSAHDEVIGLPVVEAIDLTAKLESPVRPSMGSLHASSVQRIRGARSAT